MGDLHDHTRDRTLLGEHCDVGDVSLADLEADVLGPANDFVIDYCYYISSLSDVKDECGTEIKLCAPSRSQGRR